MLEGAWAQSRGGGKATIVCLVVEIVLQVVRLGMAAVAGDWSRGLDIVAILLLSWTALMWVWIAAMERGR
jgi:hypothetical protein